MIYLLDRYIIHFADIKDFKKGEEEKTVGLDFVVFVDFVFIA